MEMDEGSRIIQRAKKSDCKFATSVAVRRYTNQGVCLGNVKSG